MRIFTSVPPKYANQDRLEYLRNCIDSWRRSGFTPISLNREDEVTAVKSLNLLDVISIDNSEAWYPTRFGPCFGQIFDLIGNDEPVAVINADIYMINGPETRARLENMCQSATVVARRTDVSKLGAPTGTIFFGGIDFIAFNKRVIPRTISERQIRRFQFGLPWWDYIIPASASFEAPAYRIVEPFLVHQIHEDRWDRDVWRRVSGEVTDILKGIAPKDFFKGTEPGEMQTNDACVRWLFAKDSVFQTENLPLANDEFFKSPKNLLPRKRRRLISTRRFSNFLKQFVSKKT